MVENDDAAEVASTIDRLTARFPTVARQHIEEVVQEELHRLDGAKVRDFVPLLAENAATERLRLEAEPVMTTTPEEAADSSRELTGSDLDPMQRERRAEPAGGPLIGNAGHS